MWVGSVSGGIWRTDNGGDSWQPVNDFLANLAVSTMVINRANTDVMYAGTGEGFANVNGNFTDFIQGAGVFQSTDRGATWNQLASTNNANFFFVNRLAISPNGNTILAATNTGIWRSTNGGTTWTQATLSQTFDIDFHPTDNSRAIAGGEGGAQLSTDGGQTWNAATFSPVINPQPTTPPPPAPPPQILNRRIEVAYAPSAPGTVYASVHQAQTGAASGTYRGETYRSTDGGQTFNRVNTTDFLGGQGWYDNTIWVDPQDDRFVIVGGVHLWRSTDSGATFIQISDGSANSAHADHHIIVAHPGFLTGTIFSTVYFGNDGGISRTPIVAAATTTSGWVEMNNNLGITQFYGAAGNATSGVIVGGTQDNGTLRFSGNTEGWTSMQGSDGGYCASDPTDGNFFYGETQNLGVVRSTDGGLTSAPISAGIADAGNNTNFIAPLVLDPNDPNTLLAGGLSLWRSTDVKAATPIWTQIKQPVTPPLPPNNDVRISAIAVSPIGSNIICVGHNNGNIFLTFNGTADSPGWTQINTSALPTRMVTRLVIDSTRSPTSWIYATFGGFSADNVYRSTNLGVTWTDITGTGATGLPNVPVRSLVYHPRNSNLLYAGTEVGIFTSNNAGANWEPTQDGPANVSVDELFWMGADLIAATFGRGLYRASGGIYVDCNHTGVERGTFAEPFRTVSAAVNATTRYQTIWIKPCNYNETFLASPINRRLELRSLGGTAVIGRP